MTLKGSIWSVEWSFHAIWVQKLNIFVKKCTLLLLNLLNFSDNMTLAICPGICNSSESVYIRRVVYHAQLEGFRVAVLNHIGALKTLSITSPRYIYHFSF